MTNPRLVAGAVAAAVLAACAVLIAQPRPATPAEPKEKPIMKNREELKKRLTPEQYHVVCEQGTEPPFRNAYWNNKKDGAYHCAACDALLFDSRTKFDSGTGWPSFWQAARSNAVAEARDASHGMERVEAVCSKCGAHLGHVFPDGPQPTGMRYCINSASLDFQPREAATSGAAKH